MSEKWVVPELTRRQKNIIRRMAEGYLYGSKGSPYMTEKEGIELSKLGFRIQSAPLALSDTSDGRVYFPLYRRDFRAKAKLAGLYDGEVY